MLFLGAATPAGAWGPIVRARHPDLVVIGTTMTDALEPVRATLAAVKSARPECLTVIGGQAYEAAPGAADRFGADIVSVDARELVGRLGPGGPQGAS